MSLYNITVREIERLRIEEKIISAKTVRKLISTRNEKELRDFVPESVLEYLKENYF